MIKLRMEMMITISRAGMMRAEMTTMRTEMTRVRTEMTTTRTGMEMMMRTGTETMTI